MLAIQHAPHPKTDIIFHNIFQPPRILFIEETRIPRNVGITIGKQGDKITAFTVRYREFVRNTNSYLSYIMITYQLIDLFCDSRGRIYSTTPPVLNTAKNLQSKRNWEGIASFEDQNAAIKALDSDIEKIKKKIAGITSVEAQNAAIKALNVDEKAKKIVEIEKRIVKFNAEITNVINLSSALSAQERAEVLKRIQPPSIDRFKILAIYYPSIFSDTVKVLERSTQLLEKINTSPLSVTARAMVKDSNAQGMAILQYISEAINNLIKDKFPATNPKPVKEFQQLMTGDDFLTLDIINEHIITLMEMVFSINDKFFAENNQSSFLP